MSTQGGAQRGAARQDDRARFDLAVQLVDAASAESCREHLRLLARLGYDGAAVARCVARKVGRSDAGQVSAIELSAGGAGRFRQFSRLTATLSEAAHAYALNPSNGVTPTYDLVAAVPTTEPLFDQCCRQLDVDLISLPLAERLPFRLSLPPIAAAIARGVHFEICYAPALRDSSARRNLISNAQQLLRLTRGRNVVLSSGAERPMELRGPHDVANLCVAPPALAWLPLLTAAAAEASCLA